MTEPLLSAEEIRRRLLAVRYSSMTERYAGRALSINRIARAADLSRRMLYYVITGDCRLSDYGSARRRLSRVLQRL